MEYAYLFTMSVIINYQINEYLRYILLLADIKTENNRLNM